MASKKHVPVTLERPPTATPGALPQHAPARDLDAFVHRDGARLVALASIERDRRAQPRAQLDPATVETYRAAMAGEEGAPSWGAFPPVVVFGEGERFYLADGFHRAEAAQLAGLEAVRAEVRAGGLREAILHSVGANATHGLPRTNEDKRRALLTLLRDPEWRQWGARELARRANVSHDLAARLRSSFLASLSSDDSQPPSSLSSDDSEPSRARYITRHGTEATMATGKIGRGRPAAAVEPPAVEPDLDDGQADEDSPPAPLVRVSKADVRAVLEAIGGDIERTDGDARRWLLGRLEGVRRELRRRLPR